MAKYCCYCLGAFYCCYGSLISYKICEDEYIKRKRKIKRIKKEYNTVRDINYETELSNIRLTMVESKLSTIMEEDESTLLY
tara:strand:+ start:322 stop:564 length:243 start_codon:yes stop_codon:yes gene_type:complete